MVYLMFGLFIYEFFWFFFGHTGDVQGLSLAMCLEIT